MPSIRYMNQTAPFWDFVASLEDQGSSHPFFAANNNRSESSDTENEGPSAWEAGPWGGFPFATFPHRGRGGGHPHGRCGTGSHHHGPSSPPEHAGSEHEDPPEVPPPPPGPHGHHHGPEHQHRRGGFGRRGGWGGWGRGNRGAAPFGGPGGFPMGGLENLAGMFQSQLFGDNDTAKDTKNEDFKPEVDIFDTETAYVVHASLPGAKKEDVGVSWDAERSELSIAGVIYRPGDEEMLKTLALDERKIGPFERKVRLGSRANPAQVDVDGISAKMEDGVLRVDVPKLDSGYVEIKKVDIE